MNGSNMDDCPICLQSLLQPVEIPCGHIFCYLCLKGSAFHRRKCPLCRGGISMDFFKNPNMIRTANEASKQERIPSEMVWYYEGRNGWWQYDERTASEIETAFSESLPKCEVFIAGHFYIIDFVNMCQFRKDHSGRSRRIKRDSPNTSKKGVAGIRLSLLQTPTTSATNDEGPADGIASDASDSLPAPSSVNSTSPLLAPTGNSPNPNSFSSTASQSPPQPS